MNTNIPEWSPRGTYHPFPGQGPMEFEHVTVEPCTVRIATCHVCCRSNYERIGGEYQPNGLRLLELGINPNGHQRSVTRVCPECAVTVGGKLQAAGELIGARWEDIVAAYDAHHQREDEDDDEDDDGSAVIYLP